MDKKLKYIKAWDNKLKKYVVPSEISEIERHDRNRYFSEKFDADEDKGEVLTLHKQSKVCKSKNGIEFTRQAHFSAIGKNTKEYRERTAKLINRQESIVHKLCKELIEEIKFIRVPEVKANIMGVDYTVLHNQLISIELKAIEKKDTQSGRIPDAIIIADMLGSKQEINLEFLYSHEVDEQKRRRLEYHNKNCLEVDLSHLRDNLEESEKSLRKKIKKIIEGRCYWVTNSVKLYCEKDALSKYAIEISKKSGLLRDTRYYNKENVGDAEKLYKRLYLFKDNIRDIDESHPCYFVEDMYTEYTLDEKCRHIGDCAKCKNCLWIANYTDNNTDNVKIFCKRNGDSKRVNPFEFVQRVIDTAIEMASIN